MTAARYRKLPVVIEAMQWDGTAAGATPIIDWVLAGDGRASLRCKPNATASCNEGGHDLFISTLEGDMMAITGDFIIRGVKGEFYPCRREIFEATYEPEG